ncbi:hypothetical protein CALVIDRAFT_542713 [Calocera viscosa TUFC12733]|uniref:Transcriptional adapter 3 n=1 Tax=Calocera viscosa (strain TUFC12733) TaxID=1330018 RepID=A0A167GBT9_CALVF|nr:hypothetical protein CALVIDRAFT_542713 [Calocera viscosa TUFC12733]
MAPPATAHSPPFYSYPLAPSVPVYPQPADPIPSLDDINLLEGQLRQRKDLAHSNYEKSLRDLTVLGRIMEKVERVKERKAGETKLEEKEVRLESLKPTLPGLVVPLEREPQLKDSSMTPRSSVPPKKVIQKVVNKNKRKRVDSDDDESYAPERRTPISPPPSYPKHKHPQHSSSAAVSKIKAPREPMPNMNDDSYWRLPERPSLIPPHPPPPDPPVPGPLHQRDVAIDLSEAKPPASQITADTFWKSVEPWTRDLGEEDVAAMSYIDDDPEPFVIPPLGKHYLDRWADEESGLYNGQGHGQRVDAKGLPFPPTQGYDPTDLSDQDWLSEEKSLGPVAERLVSALQPKKPHPPVIGPDGQEDKRELIEAIAEELQVEDALAAGPLGDLRVSAEELDVRIKRQLKELGLWTEPEPDFSAPEDDSLLAELRQCQKLLKDQMSLNAARKYRLLKRCEDRLAYQDYVHQLERMDEQILSEYQKLTKKAAQEAKKSRQASASSAGVHKANGKERERGERASTAASASHSPSVDPRSSAAPEVKRPTVPAELLHAVRIRQRLVDELGSVFEQGERECPGRFWGLPEQSLYRGITVEEGRNVLRRVNVGHPALM